jgi:hypothetical protein
MSTHYSLDSSSSHHSIDKSQSRPVPTEMPVRDSDFYLDQLVTEILAIAKPKQANS